MKNPLRIIIDGPRDPWLNMAIDEAIMIHRPHYDFDTLRIYMWLPSGVSIGRRQIAHQTVDMEEIKRHGFKLVRRITGGGAILHQENSELTYSVVLSKDHEIYQIDVVNSATRIARGIANTLEILGIEAQTGTTQNTIEEQNLCYLRNAQSDIIVHNKKISGNAQRREPYALLQHGTLLLDFHPETWLKVIKTPNTTPQQLQQRITSLKNILNNISTKQIIKSMIQGFTQTLNPINVFSSTLTEEELETANILYYNKYSTETWNMKGTT
ncbi:MAG: biotin/lipoate A/B protein ligase family protein [Thermoprotei archaeon]